MINEDPNMGRKQIFTELPLPSKVEEKGILTLIYKGVFIAIKLLLDIRLNLVKISEGKTIKTKFKQDGSRSGRSQKPNTPKPDNPIRGLDDIKVEDKPDTKVDDSTVEKTPHKERPVKLKEGSVNKGGVNEEPTSPRPEEPPAGQAPKKEEKKEDIKPIPETDSDEKSDDTFI